MLIYPLDITIEHLNNWDQHSSDEASLQSI